MAMIKSNNVSNFAFASVDADATLKAVHAKSGAQVIEEITSSKLRGCGGAGFPTGLKLSLLSKETATPKYIICNADEGEPGTFKDREILTNYADLVFAGMAIAAHATSATNGILYLRAEYNYMRSHLDNIIAKYRNAGFDITIRLGAGAYVCGEETALIESIEGKRGEPRNRPPFPIQEGFLNKPTGVNNVETFAWITTIMAKGAKWFNSVGTEKSAGYKLFSISGDCHKPGVYELPMGTTIAEMLKIVDGTGAKAVQVGGASGQLINTANFTRKLAFEDAPPGGSIMIFGAQRNMLEVVENFLDFFCDESCGQCTPCRMGNPKLLEGVKLLQSGECKPEYLEELVSLCSTMQLASKCALGQSSPNAFLAVIKDFSSEIMGRGK